MYKNIFITSETFESAKVYWLEKLQGMESKSYMLADFPGASPCKDVMAVHNVQLKPENADRIAMVSKNNELSMFVVLLAVFKILLHKTSGECDIVVSSPTLKKSRQDYNKFVILRDIINPRATFKETLIQIKQTVAEGYKNQYYPVKKLIELLGEEYGAFCFNLLLILENIHERKLPPEIIDIYKNKLTFSFSKNDGTLTGQIIYNSELFKSETIQVLFNCYQGILHQVLSNTSLRVEHIEMVTQEEKKELLYGLNHTGEGDEYPAGKTINQLFEKQVEKTPHHTAIKSAKDLSDIPRELESSDTYQTSIKKIKSCFFKKNNFIYESESTLTFSHNSSTGFVLLKTHKHNCAVVNINLLRLLDLFNGERDVESLFLNIKDLGLKFCLYSLDVMDVLEVSYRLNRQTGEILVQSVEDFVALIRLLYNTHLIVPAKLKVCPSHGTIENLPVGYFEKNESLEANIDVFGLLNQGKKPSKAHVLLLGDTPGTSTTGLLYLASYLTRNGYKAYCQFYDPNLEYQAMQKNIRELLDMIRPAVVGVSMKWFPYIARVLEITRIIKEHSPHIKVVIGGNTAAYYREDIIKNQHVDFVIKGDGEVPLLSICRQEKYLPNCIYKKGDQIIDNPITYVQDESSSPEIYLSYLDEILLSDYSSIPGTFFIWTHKGCGMNCFYCGGCRSAQVEIFNRSKPFKRNVKEVRNDILAARKYTSTFMFDFISSNEKVLEYCKQIWEGIDLTGHFCIYVNLIPPSPRIISLLTRTFKYVYWDLDIASLSEKHRKQLFSLGLVKPQPTDKEILACFDECEKYSNNEIRINLINGLPFITRDDVKQSRRMLAHLMDVYSCFSDLHWGRLHAQPGAPVVENAQTYGMYSQASTFQDFLKSSEINFTSHSKIDFSNIDTPYIYFKDDGMNSLVSQYYSETNLEISQYKKSKRIKWNIIESLSYFELNKKANQLARVLRQKGAAANCIVGLDIQDTTAVALGILGVLKAGAAYLPLDPQYPEDRKKFIMQDSGIELLVKDSLSSPEAGKKSSMALPLIISIHEDSLLKECPINLEPVNNTSNPAYVVYTSGTTAKPKGVVVEHRSIVNYTYWRQKAYQYTGNDVALQLLPYCFDGFASNFYTSLLSGGTLIMVHDPQKLDPGHLRKMIRQGGVTNASMVPGLYDMLLDSVASDDIQDFRFVVLAGEKAKIDLIEKSKQKKPNILIINEYGPTETTVTAAANIGMDETNITVIGNSISNVWIYLLNKFKQVVPRGLIGEICIAGVSLARGYLNNPGLSQEKFIDNPFKPGEKLYLSGDFGRWLPDGKLEFLKREDEQVKVRGIRVEVKEVEAQLLGHESVKETVVVAKKDKHGDHYLCCYLVTRQEIDLPGMKEYLAKKLPAHMIPSHFQSIDSLPRTSAGKVDRVYLANLEIKTKPENNGVDSEKPRNRIETRLVEVWSEVLGIEQEHIGLDDNFFELGGHSLKATSLVSKLHKELNINVPVVEIFKKPTIKHLSEFINELQEDRYFSLEAVEKKEFYTMSPAQRRLYFLQQLEPGSTAYNISAALELEHPQDRRRLEEAFGKLIQRHESLRTSFIMVNEEPVQRVHDEVEFEIEYYSATEDTGSTGENPFDLSGAPLLRVGLIETGESSHILKIYMHHIITDGISQHILTGEFKELYTGKEPEPLRLQYKDFSEWQNSNQQQQLIKKQEQYWLNIFSGQLPVLDLPIDCKRPEIQSFAGSYVTFFMDQKETQYLKNIKKENDVTLFMFLLAVFSILLAKLSGQEDIIVGIPISARRHKELGNIIGMFVNTLASRNFPGGEKSFNDFLEEIRKQTLETIENQEYPFEDLVDKVSISRDASRNPLFDVMFIMQNMEITGLDIPGIKILPDKQEANISKFDLSLTVGEAQAGLFFSFEYCTKLFKKKTIERFITYFKKIVSYVLKEKDTKISEIEIIDEKEKNKLLFEFNKTGCSYPADKLIHQIFAEQVERTPDDIALLGQNPQSAIRNSKLLEGTRGLAPSSVPISVTYNELNRRSHQLAYWLKEKGVVSDTIVGIMVERSLEMIIGILGILKSGGAYLPIDPDYPRKRIDFMLKDSNARILLKDNSVELKRPETNLNDQNKINTRHVLNFKHLSFEFVSTFDFRISDIRPANLSYIIYTSGTTGKPKGVMISHRNLVRLFVNSKNPFDFRTGDVWTMFHSHCFDFSVWEIYGALLNGGRLIVIPAMVAKDTPYYLQILRKQQVTVLNQTPSAFYNLINHEVMNTGKDLRLRYVILGGEALTPAKLEQWRDRYPETRVINMFGITETTVHVTFKEITNKEIEQNISNIGRPIPTLTTYVMDKNQKLLPLGVAGELCIGGDGLARGYLNRPQLTVEKFVENPIKPGELLYRSGDLVRIINDGDMQYLGRMDHQVQLRGYRIELGEIENRLSSLQEVKGTVVIDREDESGDKYLCAYIVPHKGRELNGNETMAKKLQEHLSKTLPGYMIPLYFVLLDEIRLTPNGKIDRDALPAPGVNSSTCEYIPPRDQVEVELAALWSEVLNIEKVGINDNFFELGGHSLKATVLVSKIHKTFHIKIPLAGIFKTPRIKELSEYIKEGAKEKYKSIVLVEKKEFYVLSSAQRRLYILQQMELAGTAYNMPMAMIIEGMVAKEKFEKTFRELIDRHESLRTSFEMIGEQPVQRVYDEVEFDIETGQHHSSKNRIIHHFIRPFDLSQAPLLRVGLIRLEQEEQLLIVDMHHIISDGLSTNILVENFISLYNGEKLSRLKLQYKDYSQWQSSERESEIIKKQGSYWIKEFSGEIPVLNLPIDHQRPTHMSFEGNTLHFEIGTAKTNSLKRMASEEKATLYMVMLSIFNILLTKITLQEDLVVGTTTAGRRHADLERIIGLFINTLALRNKPHGEKTFKEFLKQVKDKVLAAFDNQDYPFEKLVEKLGLNRKSNRNPLFDTAFEFNNQENDLAGDRPREKIPGLQLKPFDYGKKNAGFDLTLAVTDAGETLHLEIEYNTTLFERDTVERMIGLLKNIVSKVISNPGKKIAEIVVSSETEGITMLTSTKELTAEFDY